jgi:hypothetical protein
MDMKIVREEIEKLKALQRNHASFYNWHDKEIQELGIAQDFFQKLEEISNDKLVSIKNAEDPPDIGVVTKSGRNIAIEITELVDQKAIEYEIKGDSRYSERVVAWNKENTIEAVTNIINKKDTLCERVPKEYDTTTLLIFTDEPRLTSDNLKEYLKETKWPDTNHINEVYILTGYEPIYDTKCLIKLK